MFSRMGHVARRASARVVSMPAAQASTAAARGVVSRGAALSGGASAAGVLAVAAAGAVALASERQQQQETALCAAPTFKYTGEPGTAHERSFIAIKPDGVQRQLVGEVISRFEKKGYKLVAMKMIWPTKEMAANHYADLSKKPFFSGLVDYFSSGPIVAMVWEGPEVILTGRKMLGATNPNSSEPGSLRGDYCIRVGRNLVHGSDGGESAQHEIGMWFTEEECSAWPRTLDAWIVADN
ncbi:unnamed protein product [Ectocarpus sp. CCAP 1310/34]|nr:unnamed protein product [Ectocarpus sp. CCAP 1310/34]